MGDIKIKEAKNIEKLRIGEVSNIAPIVVSEVRAIAPAAVHIKELNQIDPISIESLRVNEVKNLDPLRVETFNVTNLPTVNLSLRQLPSVDLNVRRVPPLSVGLHQDFCLPSRYTVRAQVLGFELFRVNVDGQTMLIPRERARREQDRTPNRSFPEVAVAGNPAIPTKHTVTSRTIITGAPDHPTHAHGHHQPHRHAAPAPSVPQGMWRAAGAPARGFSGASTRPRPARGPLHAGQPPAAFSLGRRTDIDSGPSSVGGGEA